MHSLAKIFGAVALLGVVGATGAAAGSPKRFDLICNGTAVDNPADSAQNRAFPFETRIKVDTASKRFCMDGFCGTFTRADRTFFEYECGGDKSACEPGKKVEADGPFVRVDHFTFDWTSAVFKRTSAGERGDKVREPFQVVYSGACKFGSFSGLRP
jgi:hypothetical protein